MDPVFSIGISSLWDELRHMPAGGVWWFNVDRHEDAISLANQTIASQAETAHVALMNPLMILVKIIKLRWIHVTNGAIVIHTQRLKSDPGGNLLS